MSEPAGTPAELPERKLHRLHPDDEAELATESAEVVALDAKQTEAYLRWLETGEGPDPCAGAFSK